MTGSGPLWRKANPFAAPSAILTLLDHGRGTVPSRSRQNQHFYWKIQGFYEKIHEITCSFPNIILSILLCNST